MARKKKETTAPQQETEAVKPSEVRKMPSARVLKALIKEDAALREEFAEKRGEHGANVKNAVENQNLHKGALAILKKFYRMEPEKLADLWDHLNHGMEVLGLHTRIESVQRLDLAPAGEDGEDEGEPEPENVHKFPATAH